ncbi:(R,R)-butanediol dehydrogenase [Cyphellophora attinorum]|uniref:(R,R)-butanediol dehydrogenase n=1 Tax=Cyphellophora attinorum TaxID=1664694 RepID=A0A0N1P054_9EURO|nr:(R,R)-butanediol dehydrogenase [Phialophora attinorum]KPI42707.1 (R,R)-butanediol dehydrogenase [Phialophora attinorum]
MRAAQFHAARDIRITTTAPVPASPPPPGYVNIDIEWCGICGSDLHEYLVGPLVIPTEKRPHPLTGESIPVTLGHEFCGRVSEVGPRESSNGTTGVNGNGHSNGSVNGGLKPGTPVMIDPRLNCQSCTSCTAANIPNPSSHACSGRKTHLCDKWGFHGLSGRGGGLSEKVCVRADMVYALPDREDVLKHAALIEPLAVARHAVKATGIENFGELNVLILGGGPIGLAVVQDLRVVGVKKLIVSEPTETRQKQVRKYVDVVLNPKSEDVPARCKELTSGAGVDVVFDCAGVGPGMQSGMASLKVQGLYMNVAGWETPFTVPMQYWMMKELTLKASLAYDEEDFAKTVQNSPKGLEDMVTARIALEDAKVGGFDELVNNKDKHIKILVTPRRDLL